MKNISRILLIACFGFSLNPSFSQSFNNGDFEITTAATCHFNLNDALFNTLMPDVHSFGSVNLAGYSSEVDIQSDGCYITPQSGARCLGLASHVTIGGDAISIELSADLVIGTDYELSYYVYGNLEFTDSLSTIEVGESLVDSVFGTLINSSIPVAYTWVNVSVIFTASQASKYITVRADAVTTGWTQIDNFTLKESTISLNEFDHASPLIAYPNPANSTITVDFKQYVSSGRATLIDMYGRVVSSSQIASSEKINMELSEIPSGMYFIKIESPEVVDMIKFTKE
jgi:hypothetical protein